MIKKCGNCKHWEEIYYFKSQKIRYCEKCTDGAELVPSDMLKQPNNFFSQDAEGYGSGLITKADFGCVNFEVK